jgi:hypothetical protein
MFRLVGAQVSHHGTWQTSLGMRYSWQRKNLLVLTGIRKVRFKGPLYPLPRNHRAVNVSDTANLACYMFAKAVQSGKRLQCVYFVKLQSVLTLAQYAVGTENVKLQCALV